MNVLEMVRCILMKDSWRCLQSAIVFFAIFRILRRSIRRTNKPNKSNFDEIGNTNNTNKCSSELVFIRNLSYDFFCRKRKLFDEISTLSLVGRRNKCASSITGASTKYIPSDTINMTVYLQYFDRSIKFEVSPHDIIKDAIRCLTGTELLIHEGEIVRNFNKTFNEWGIKHMSTIYCVREEKSKSKNRIERYTKYMRRFYADNEIECRVLICVILIVLWLLEYTAQEIMLYPLMTICAIFLIQPYFS